MGETLKTLIEEHAAELEQELDGLFNDFGDEIEISMKFDFEGVKDVEVYRLSVKRERLEV